VLIAVAVLLLVGVVVTIASYCRVKKRRLAGAGVIDHYAQPRYNDVHMVPNPTYHIDTDDRARTGNVVVTTAADQIQYLIPMVEQAPGEYMEAVARNQDYTYAPPMQSPANYEVIDESGGNPTAIRRVGASAGGGGGGGGGGKRKTGGGRDVDPNGYVVDASSAPGDPGGGGGGRNVDPSGYVVDGSRGPGGSGRSGTMVRPVVYASYFEGSPSGTTNPSSEYGIPTEYDNVVPEGSRNAISGGAIAVYGTDMNEGVVLPAYAANPKRMRQLQLLAGAGAGATAADRVGVGVGGGGRTHIGAVRRAYVNDEAVESFLADYAESPAVNQSPAPDADMRVVGKATTLRRKYVNVIEGDEDSTA
jgi:hypothetical protein